MFTLIMTTMILGGIPGSPTDPLKVLSVSHTTIGGFERQDLCASAATQLHGGYINFQRAAICVEMK